jgi:integrase
MGRDMTKIRLAYVHEFRDRHGRVRRYVRLPGFKRIALPGAPGSPEFMAVYNAARSGHEIERRPIGANRSVPGTVSAAIAAYYLDASFLALAEGSRKMRRAILERFRAAHGDKRLALMQQHNVAAMLGTMKPFASRNWLKTLRGLMQFAIAAELRFDDPTAAIKPAKARSGTIHTWTEREIEQFEARHPIGTRPRLAMALMLYTGQRRSDAVRMGPQHVRAGVLAVRQQKTGRHLEIPVHPQLAAIIDASPSGHLTFLTAAGGKPFSTAGFGNVFRQWCDEAGLPQCSSHGLRKAQCRRLAEAGCSAPQIAAISGHMSLREVQRYIEAADQARLARSAMARIGNADWQTTPTGLPKRETSC